MTDNEQSQLRFDISENVSFLDEMPGIDTLLSLDLTPEVRIEHLGANVRIAGVIRLSGSYLGQSDESPAERAEQLADMSEADEELVGENIHYVIPVEITLPAERVERLEDITAEIQSFDYELRSAHEIAIEALLVVDGLQLGSEVNTSEANFGERDDKEALISRQGELDEAAADPELSKGALQANEPQPVEESLRQEQPLDEADAVADSTEARVEQPFELSDELGSTDEIAEPAEEQFHHADEQLHKDDEVATAPSQSKESSHQESTTDPQTKNADEQPQTKIRFQSKVEQQKSSDTISLNDMLVKEDTEAVEDEGHALDEDTSYQQTDGRDNLDVSDEPLSDDNSLDEPTSEAANLTGIELMKQHLAGTEEHFRRLRMVIVQKEDTLESIADRYELSSVELLQLNKLESGELEQGQIVYLPDRTDEP